MFFRYNAGNIVDVTTLRSTLVELKALGVNTEYAIIDAGYYSEANIRCLYGEDDKEVPISFLSRLSSHLKLFKQLAAEHMEDLLGARYFLMQRDRLVSVKRVEVDLFGHVGYAYLVIDRARREAEICRYVRLVLESGEVFAGEMDEVIKFKGLFILISSECIEPGEVLSLYYTRQAVEQVFDVGKNYVELLPLRVHSEETFRGYLMLSFIVSAVFLSLNQMLKGTEFNAQGAFCVLRNQKCKVYDDCILPKEPDKDVNEIYKKLKIDSPVRLSICGEN